MSGALAASTHDVVVLGLCSALLGVFISSSALEYRAGYLRFDAGFVVVHRLFREPVEIPLGASVSMFKKRFCSPVRVLVISWNGNRVRVRGVAVVPNPIPASLRTRPDPRTELEQKGLVFVDSSV
jgi:hypothetical protein